ncbi:alpha-amylase [Alteromonas pelagimontana]|uniref:Alpha-amylase n=1 Tax=Alteromonas pelagimontana TaxID=1858656 RepID=A0A6M4MHF1_9ALTE|nr:glycoside hydrolase family 13 protein [Alteromonas pelagimontana]QJR82539.1 alpha-amylase [Alteromonas pelagimontana]
MPNLKTVISLCLSFALWSGISNAAVVSPPNWWVGMESSELQLMVYEPNIAHSKVSTDYPGVTIKKVSSLDSPNYLFIDLVIEDAAAGQLTLEFIKEGHTVTTVEYELASRRKNSAQRQGFSSKDAIYLLTPDRFANGDTRNDNVQGYTERLDRTTPGGRHGGDVQGIIDHLDYLKEMGFTQIWTMPLLENAMDSYSYHGYAITDYYQLDPRYGTNELYKTLSAKARDKGIGVIMDMVLNHIGSSHSWMTDAPSKDWIHNRGEFTPTTHQRESLHDPHGVKEDQQAFSDGWFVPSMPDLNQQNRFLATYLIQNAIWWVEYADLSGIRVDTYSYSDRAFLSEWTRRLMQEYPDFNIVGEEWSTNPLITSYWQRGTNRYDDYKSYLPSVMDFPLQAQIAPALKEKESWETGLKSLYDILTSDFIYGDPYNLVVFADNHDMSRIFTQLDESQALWDMAMTYVLTTRGIPQIFYGTEILMGNAGTEDHGIIRSDFPGGWKGDKVNAFTGEGLSDHQRQAQQRVRSLLHLRQNHPVVATGRLTHFAPVDGVYVYLRHQDDINEAVLVVINKQAKDINLKLKRFASHLAPFAIAKKLDSQQSRALENTLPVPANSATVWILQ